MARPTNKERVLRLLRTMGRDYVALNEPGVEEPFKALPLDDVRAALGPGSDGAILDLILHHGSDTDVYMADVMRTDRKPEAVWYRDHKPCTTHPAGEVHNADHMLCLTEG